MAVATATTGFVPALFFIFALTFRACLPARRCLRRGFTFTDSLFFALRT